MPDYKKMYLRMFRASEEAINLLIQAQRECEELFLEDTGPGLILLPPQEEQAGEASPSNPE